MVTRSLLPFLSLLRLSSTIQVLFLYSVLHRDDTRVQSKLAEGLIAAGDNVTVIAPVSFHRYTTELAFPSQAYFLPLERLAKQQEESLKETETEGFYDVMSYVTASCPTFYEEPIITRFLAQKQLEFNVVIVSTAYNECVLPLLAALEANFILLSANNRIPIYVKYALGIPNQPSFSPDHWSLNDRLKFTTRMRALFNYRKHINMIHYWYYKSIDWSAQKHIPSHTTLLSSMQEASALLVDSNLAIDLALPTFDLVVPIGGIQCVNGTPLSLPPDILQFVNSAPNGVIFVSFGSTVKASTLPYTSLTKLVNVFSRVRQRVVWVFDDSSVINLSSNVFPVQKIDQQSLLAHPNVQLFVNHGDHFARQEMIYHSIPGVVFPLHDPSQYANADYVHSRRIGLKFDINAFSEEMLLNGIMEVITNPVFDANVQRLSARMKDWHTHPLERAVFWTHYTVRNERAPYLKSYSMHLYWFQYYLVDVKIFIIISTLLVIYVVGGIAVWCKNRYRLSKEKAAVTPPPGDATKKLLATLKAE